MPTITPFIFYVGLLLIFVAFWYGAKKIAKWLSTRRGRNEPGWFIAEKGKWYRLRWPRQPYHKSKRPR